MDQRHLAGVGNIYANEALFAAGIDPSKPARRLTPDDHRRLHGEIQRILSSAIASSGTTVRDYRTGTGQPGNFQRELLVYGREGEPCRQLRHAVDRHAPDRRPHLRLLPPLPVVSRARRGAARRAASLD